MTARLDVEWPDHSDDASEPAEEAGSLRAWLVRGTRKFAIDPRRRSGRNPHARRMLAADAAIAANPNGAWRGLVAALQRHAVHNALAQLRSDDRQILSLAFLQGHTNHEIAGMLHVSVSTVGRRLAIALTRLEQLVRDAGIWVASFALLGLAWLSRPAESKGRLAAIVRGLRSPQSLTVVAATAVAAVTVAYVVSTPSTQAAPFAHPVGRSVTVVALVGMPTSFTGSTTKAPTVAVTLTSHARGHQSKPANSPTTAAAPASTHGCGGNPTSAAPPVPVAGPDHHPTGAPVTHPGPGGCGPKA